MVLVSMGISVTFAQCIEHGRKVPDLPLTFELLVEISDFSGMYIRVRMDELPRDRIMRARGYLQAMPIAHLMPGGSKLGPAWWTWTDTDGIPKPSWWLDPGHAVVSQPCRSRYRHFLTTLTSRDPSPFTSRTLQTRS